MEMRRSNRSRRIPDGQCLRMGGGVMELPNAIHPTAHYPAIAVDDDSREGNTSSVNLRQGKRNRVCHELRKATRCIFGHGSRPWRHLAESTWDGIAFFLAPAFRCQRASATPHR